MNINEKKPEDVLKWQFLVQYKELHQDIWLRLIRINTNLQIVEVIQQFPLDHLYSPQENVFWGSVRWNFLDLSIILLHALICDEGDDALSLPKFKNNVSTWLKDPAEYRKLLKTLHFNRITKNLCAKFTPIRRDILAHRLLDEDGKLRDPPGVTLSEIHTLYNETEKLFRSCSFGAEYVTTFYMQGTCGGKPIEKDIEHILDLLIKNSPWLNRPEQESQS